MLHAEFETLHPFLDGNGRLGRMLVPLFLWQNKLIHQPIFKSTDFIASAGIPKATAKRILPALREAGVLITFVEGSGQRSAVLSFPSLLNITEGREVF